MTETLGYPSASNPFSATRLRPGSIDYIFASDEQFDRVLARLSANGWQGQIVGPHGSGKSTLLHGLVAAVQNGGRNVLFATLLEGQRALSVSFRESLASVPCGAVVVIDGFEQLSWWRRLHLRLTCSYRRLGLLVTTHIATGLPELFRTSIDFPRAWRVVERLQSGFPLQVARGDLAACLDRSHGDLREALFGLYDVYESQRRQACQSL